MKKMLLSSLFIIILFRGVHYAHPSFSFVVNSYAETFYLKNGEIVEGIVIEENETTYKIRYATIRYPDTNYLLDALTYYLKKEEISKIEEAGALKKEFKGKDADWDRDRYTEGKSWDYYNLGIEKAIDGKFEEARKQFKDSLKVDSFFTPSQESIALIADVYSQRINKEIAIRILKLETYSNWSSVIRELEEIVVLEPDYTTAHTLLGIAYMHKEMFDKAKSEFKKAVQLNPNNAITHNNLV